LLKVGKKSRVISSPSAFAVDHLVEMVCDLKIHYHAAYKGEIEP
jgi:hypothetical protein